LEDVRRSFPAPTFQVKGDGDDEIHDHVGRLAA
jgi:hypothetical protein